MATLPTEPLQITEPAVRRGRNDLRRNLVGLSREQLKTALAEAGLEPFRARQIWQWIYWHGITDFDRMTNIAKKSRERLAELFVVARPEIVTEQRSVDGTRKWLLRFPDGNEAETVNIPEEDRGSVCVSSQVGCTLTCSFCHTGTQPLVRNLTPDEIVGQFMVARDSYREWPTPTADATRMLSNIVMMGMGEPLYNFDNVVTALKIVMDDQGIALSRRRITLSTSGVVPMIPKVGEALDVNLAVSLHAVSDDVRDTLVPINRKWPIAELLRACADYPGARNSRRITFEYAMLKLIPFNPWPGAPYECSSNNRIHRFAEIVNDGGLSAPVRTPRGRDISAACGQLKSESVRGRRDKVLL
jgi:23S rRNA (adenine2503-C2)-methyltransferase